VSARTLNPWNLFVGAMIPNWLCARGELSPGAKLCYARLCQYAGQHGVAFPSQLELSTALGVSERHARRYLRELSAIGPQGEPLTYPPLIQVHRAGLRKTNRITFLLHPWMGVDGLWKTPANRTITSGQERTETSGPIGRESEEENHRKRAKPPLRARATSSPLPGHRPGEHLVTGLSHALNLPGAWQPGLKQHQVAAVRAKLDTLSAADRDKVEGFAGWLLKTGVADDVAQAILSDYLAHPEVDNPFAYYAAGSEARRRLQRALA
jgi:hypothetical protein